MKAIIPRVFICHAGADKRFVRRIASDLVKEGIGVWFDEWEIRVGDSISSKIRDGLKNAEHIMVVISKSLLASRGALRELDSSLIRATYEKGVSLLPVRIDDSSPPADMADLLYADFHESYELGISRVKQAVLLAAQVTDSEIVLSVSGDSSHGLDPAVLVPQLRSAVECYADKKREIIVRFKPGKLLLHLESKITERLNTLDSEPQEWQKPEHDLAGRLRRDVQRARNDLKVFQGCLRQLVEAMLECGKYGVFDISAVLG